MQPIRRLHEHRSRWTRRFFQLWYSNQSLWVILILWAITGYKSLSAYQQLAQELRPDNPLCSSSSACPHIQFRLHIALLGQILSLYVLYEILMTIFWPLDGVGGDIQMTPELLKDWYRWYSLMIVIVSFLALIFMETYDNVVPWISGLYAVFRVCLFVAYFILMMHRLTTVVVVQRVEQPESNERGSAQGESDIPSDQSRSMLHRILSRMFCQYWVRLITDPRYCLRLIRDQYWVRRITDQYWVRWIADHMYWYIDVPITVSLILGFIFKDRWC